MTERIYRIILGVSLLTILYFDVHYALYFYVALIMLEGITNFRMPIVITFFRTGEKPQYVSSSTARFNFDAERMLRIVIAILVFISFTIYPDALWFFPWFIAIMLLSAGITNNCPMFLLIKWAGFK